MATQRKQSNNIDVIANDISYIRDDLVEIKSTLKGSYVTKEEFEPIKKIVYGLVGLILIAVVGALMGLVLIK